MPILGAAAPVTVEVSTSSPRAVAVAAKERVHTPAVPVWSDSQAIAKSPVKSVAMAGCRCWPPALTLAVRRESVTAPLDRASRTRPML